MVILVTGASGQLGSDVMQELKSRGHFCLGTSRKRRKSNDIVLDITDREIVRRTLQNFKLDAVIHCAAWTDVDGAEDEENKTQVFNTNALGTFNIALACKEFDIKMIYISSDYVFSGRGTEPWRPDSKTHPINVYGRSKLDGEMAVANLLDRFFIVRVSWLFGVNGKNFVKTMLEVGQKYPEVSVVDDQIGLPTYTADLARLLVDMAESTHYGYYHATSSGPSFISWADFTEDIYRLAKIDTPVKRVSTEEYGLSKAKRPSNSRLDTSKLGENGFDSLPSYKGAIAHFLRETNFF